MKKLGLVLGSGGARGIAHVGFLQALEENGIKPDCISGCSMGSVVGGLYCKGMKPSEMFDVIKGLKSSDIIDFDLVGFSNKAILKTSKMTKLVDALFDGVTFSKLKIPFTCNAFDMNKAKTVWFTRGSVSTAVRASSSIPGVFKPVVIGEKQLIDGGIVLRMPIEGVRKMGAEVIVGVDVLGKLRKTYDDKNMITHILRIIDAVDWAQTESNYKNNDYDLLLMPELGAMSQYMVKNLIFAYEKGYELGNKNADKIKELIK